jgi:hypothetical protein
MTNFFEFAKDLANMQASLVRPEGERTVHQITLTELKSLMAAGPYHVDKLSGNCSKYFFRNCDVYELIDAKGNSLFFEIPVA